MAGRNWMLRRLLVETIVRDPAYANGDYETQPPALRLANVFFTVATNGGARALRALAPTRLAADRYVDELLAAPPPADANDFVYQWRATADFDPTGGIGNIVAPTLAITSADDERDPPELAVMEGVLKNIAGARQYVIPASEETRGHGTTALARFWAPQLAEFLAAAPSRASRGGQD
jgi:homoserine O-acetyltransferase